MKAILFLILFLLYGCASPSLVQYKVVCPRTTLYSKEDQQNLGKELKKLAPNNIIIKFLINYKKERDMLIACGNK